MLLLIYALVIGVIQTYAIRQMALKAQNAVDSIADGVAIYMIQNDGASYQEAYTQAEKLKKLLQSKTNIDIVDLQMDADAFEKNKIRVTLSVGQWYLPSLASIHWDQDKTKYQIQKTATTEFISSNSYGTGATAQGTAIVQFALQLSLIHI